MTERTYPDGVPCWVDTVQPDVGAAITFYGALFGWTFEAGVLAQDETQWTRTALVRAPQGAEFTVSQFTPAGA